MISPFVVPTNSLRLRTMTAIINRQRRQADGDRSRDAAGNAKRPRQFRFANPQRYQSPEFQQNAQPGQQHVEDEVSLESEWIADSPEDRARRNGEPGRAGARSVAA